MRSILYVTAFVPGRSGAGENFSRQFINEISASNHVDLIYSKYSHDEKYFIESENVTVLRIFRNSICIKLINFLMFPLVFPLFSVRFNLLRLLYIKRMIREHGYSLIIFDFSQTFLFAKFLKGVQVLLYCDDVIAQRYSRVYYGAFGSFVRYSERFVLNNESAKIFCPSEKDKQLLLDLYNIKSEATSVFIDKCAIDSTPGLDGSYFVFFANWNRADNSDGLKWFLKNVYPHVVNTLNFKIIGLGLPSSILLKIEKCSNIEYLGFLSDPYPVISNARALISPLFSGAGIKVKVLESLASGTPVIGTVVSFEGVPEIYSRYLIQANNEDEFIFALNNFTTNLTEKDELKKLFLSSYLNRSISAWVNTYVCNTCKTGNKG